MHYQSLEIMNKCGATEKINLVGKLVKDGDTWGRECQLSVEFNSNEASAKSRRDKLFRYEMYFANKEKYKNIAVGKSDLPYRT